ncbi:MAG: hypothetical protein KC433_13295 [Anaerolineales bacterium]|nr:hypothetical protein [Anaerolineales bacterium]MCB8939375.1 hypothetical protein [Ardenticatenaceae bacterium]
MKRLAFLLFIPLFLLACGPKEENLVTYTSSNYPITLQVPESWSVEDNEDSITIASNEEMLLTNSVVNGAVINITVTPSTFTGTAALTEMVETAVRSFRAQEEVEVLQEIEQTTINAQTAVQTVLRGPSTEGNKIILRYVMIENLTVNQTAIVAAVHDASQNDQYGQLMADIVNSIQLGEEVP